MSDATQQWNNTVHGTGSESIRVASFSIDYIIAVQVLPLPGSAHEHAYGILQRSMVTIC